MPLAALDITCYASRRSTVWATVAKAPTRDRQKFRDELLWQEYARHPRAVGDEEWRGLMEPVQAAARRLVAAGEVEITQNGVVVDPSTAKGPIRIRRTRRCGREADG